MNVWDRLERTVAPPATPVTVAELKASAKLDFTDDDTMLERLIESAAAHIEGPDGAGIALVEQTWRLSMECFPGEVRIPMGPVRSISSVVYVDGNGVSQTLAASSYQWRKDRYGARIAPAYGTVWPTHRRVYDAVQVTFVAGHAPDESGSPADYTANIPQDLRQAVLLLAAHWYQQREAASERPVTDVPFGVDAILNRYRVGRVA